MAFAFILSLFNLSALVYLFYIKHTNEGCQTGILLYESNSLDQAAATCNVFMIWGASESSEQICNSSGGFLFFWPCDNHPTRKVFGTPCLNMSTECLRHSVFYILWPNIKEIFVSAPSLVIPTIESQLISISIKVWLQTAWQFLQMLDT